MKKIIAGVFLGIVVLSSTSCKKYLDINANPNNATSATPELILPQAITYTASVLNAYNNYGAQTGLYAANAGGYGGFGEAITYNYTSTGSGLWVVSYDNLEDYQAILDKTNGVATYDYFNAVARIMKAYNFQLLVDAFNDVPYTVALKGVNNLSPAYSSAKDIYKDLASQLDTAIALINSGASVVAVVPLSSSDVMFAGDLTKWKKFANTLKLRIMVRGNGKVTFANTTFTADGFLTTDALINPGYTRDNGKQNPLWNSWAFGYTGTDANKAWEPSQFIFGFYNGMSLLDSARGKANYYKFSSAASPTGVNRLGIENSALIPCPSGSFWYSGANRTGATAGTSYGILKGPSMGMPALLASESYFLQAEAALNGLLTTGIPDDLFNAGLLAAFTYTFTSADGIAQARIADTLAYYKNQNANSYLVNIALATSSAQKLEAIITQKFIAVNFIESYEGWNDYRRTHYPTINATGTGYQTFSSSVSESTRPDKLPTRILYPTDETTYNGANVPKGIQPFSSMIFWAL